jgi:hypothetical protein
VTPVAAAEERALSEYKEEKKNPKPLNKEHNPTKNRVVCFINHFRLTLFFFLRVVCFINHLTKKEN